MTHDGSRGRRARGSDTAAADRLPVRTKLAFGVGSGAEAIVLLSISSYAMLYYNQVLGLPAHLAGLALSVSLVFDGLSDPIMGSLSDRTRSRLGRRHIYMFIAPLPIALLLMATFIPPAGLGEFGLFLWFAVCIVLIRQAMTVFHTPHLALGAELSPDYAERSRVMAYNSLFAWAGAAGASWIALTYFFKATPKYPQGLLNPQPWPAYSIVMGLVVFIVLFGSAWFTRDRIPFLPRPRADLPRFTPFEFLKDVGKAFTNASYVWLLFAYLFISLTSGLRAGLSLYTSTYFWQLGSEDIRWFLIAAVGGYLTAFLVTAQLHQRFGKRRTMVVSGLFYSLTPTIPILLGLSGRLTPQTPGLVPLLIAFSVVTYGATSILTISIMSGLADIADQNELKYGIRQEGVLYATRTLFSKVDQALGAALTGLVIGWIALPAKAVPGHIPQATLHGLAIWDGLLASVPALIAVYCYGQFNISQQSHQATRRALAARQHAKASSEGGAGTEAA